MCVKKYINVINKKNNEKNENKKKKWIFYIL